MRKINDFEREVIKRIISYFKKGIIPNLASIIYEELKDKAIYLDFANGKVEVRADYALYSQDIGFDEIRKLTVKITTVVNLLKYLQDNGYLTLLKESQNPATNSLYGQIIKGHNHISLTIEDDAVAKLLLDYSFKSIIVGQPLIEFAEVNKYKTDIQVQIDDHNKKTRRDLTLAIIGLFITIVLSFIEIHHHSQEVEYLKQLVKQGQTIQFK